MMDSLESLSLADEGCHDDEFFQEHCLRFDSLEPFAWH